LLRDLTQIKIFTKFEKAVIFAWPHFGPSVKLRLSLVKTNLLKCEKDLKRRPKTLTGDFLRDFWASERIARIF